MVAEDEVPVMTLGECVFLPGQYLPLRIFEPRYRRMLEEALDGRGHFAVSMRDADRVSDVDDEPSCPFTCVGRIAGHVRGDDGTYHVVLEGVYRGRVLRRVRKTPYPVLRIEPIGLEEEGDAVRDSRSMLLACSRLLAGGGTDAASVLRRFESLAESPGALADAVAGIFFEESEVRRRVLETVSVGDRFDFVMKRLGRLGWRNEIERGGGGGIGLN